MKRIGAVWICLILLFSSTSVFFGSVTSSLGPDDTPLSPGPGPQPEVQTYYTNRATFDADTGPLWFFEDWEEANVPPPPGANGDAPFDINSDNGWFQPGDIEPGIQIWDVPPTPNGLLVIGPGFGAPTKMVITNTFLDSMDIVFNNNDVWAVGMDIHTFIGTGTVDISIYGVGGVLLDTTTAPGDNSGIFWGVISDELITRINLEDPTGNCVEGGDNIAFGIPIGILHHIDVTPDPATVVIGDTQQFTATAYDHLNNIIPGVDFTWSTDVGFVTQTGFFIAPLTPCNGTVTATKGAISGSANVEIIIAYFDIDLSLGWNLISLPLEQIDESIDQVLGTIDGKWNYIQSYDPLSPEPWKSYSTFKPTSMNDFSTLDHKQGFWINIIESNVTLTIGGSTPFPTGVELFAGWNLVGYPSLTEKSISDALDGTSYDRPVEGFNASAPYRISQLADTYLMKPSEGYWVHVPFNTFWVVDW